MKKIISVFTLVCIILVNGCFNKKVMQQDLDQFKHEKYLIVYTTDSTYKFSELHLGEIVDDTLIVGKTKKGDLITIPVRDVEKVVLAKSHLIRTHIACLGSIGLVCFFLLMYSMLHSLRHS